jgi:hypothetical protein
MELVTARYQILFGTKMDVLHGVHAHIEIEIQNITICNNCAHILTSFFFVERAYFN